MPALRPKPVRSSRKAAVPGEVPAKPRGRGPRSKVPVAEARRAKPAKRHRVPRWVATK
jgi:hypothetical protein